MMLSTLVKISNVTNLSDARYCAGMGVEWLGFSVDEGQENYVSPKAFREIKSWLVGVRMMAESNEVSPESIIDSIKEYEIDGIQVNAKVSASALSQLTDKSVFVRIDVDDYSPVDLLPVITENPAEMYVLESSSGQFLNEDWKDIIADASKSHNILLGFGLDDPQNIQSILGTLGVAGIAIKGSEEIRPGFKDFGSLMDILEAIEEDN